MSRLFTIAVMGAICGSAMGQSFNVDVGPPGTQPPSSYAAAMHDGFWNSVTAAHITPFTPNATPQDDLLVDIDGNQTSVGFHQFGGQDPESVGSSSAAGNDGNLLNDFLLTHSIALESCLYLNGLENGLYEIVTYAWWPDKPAILQKVRFDFTPTVFTLVGGAWSGQHEEGVTYDYQVFNVTAGHIGWHVGIPAGGDTVTGAAFNGFQIHKVGGPGDPDDDGDIDISDFERFYDCLTGPGEASDKPGCIESDFNGDDHVDLEDVAVLQVDFTGSL
jgi:hypothetical protein